MSDQERSELDQIRDEIADMKRLKREVEEKLRYLSQRRDRLLAESSKPRMTQAQAHKRLVENSQRQRRQRFQAQSALQELAGGAVPSTLTPAEQAAKDSQRDPEKVAAERKAVEDKERQDAQRAKERSDSKKQE